MRVSHIVCETYKIREAMISCLFALLSRLLHDAADRNRTARSGADFRAFCYLFVTYLSVLIILIEAFP